MTKFTQGVKAAKQGLTVADCPYDAGYARREWMKGFDLAARS